MSAAGELSCDTSPTVAFKASRTETTSDLSASRDVASSIADVRASFDARATDCSSTPPPAMVTSFGSLRVAEAFPAFATFREMIADWPAVAVRLLRAMLRAVVKDMAVYLCRSLGCLRQRTRLTSTSDNSAPVWNTFELAV